MSAWPRDSASNSPKLCFQPMTPISSRKTVLVQPALT
jgi:hypothetical protein